MGPVRSAPLLAVAISAVVVGLAAPAAAHEAGHLISGNSIKPHSIAGNRFKDDTVTGKQVKTSTVGTVASAKRAAAVPPLKWHPLTLLNGWVNSFNSGPSPAYSVDSQGIVRFRGYIENALNSNQDAFQLPDSLAPSHDTDLVISQNSAATGRLDIPEFGDVEIVQDPDASTTTQSVSLDGIVWAR